MPFFVGPGSSPDGGLEMKSDRVGFPTATSDPGSAVLGDMYLQTVGAGATLRLYDGHWNDFDGDQFTATGGTKTTSGGDTIHTFTSNGNFVVPAPAKSKNIQVLMVGGGAGGGNDNGGGGAAPYQRTGGNGGSGLVLIAYPT